MYSETDVWVFIGLIVAAIITIILLFKSSNKGY